MGKKDDKKENSLTTKANNPTHNMAQVDKKELPQSGVPVSDFFIDGLKKVTTPPSRAQLDHKELPQSGVPVSDFFVDGLKKVASPPSRAQLEKKELP